MNAFANACYVRDRDTIIIYQENSVRSFMRISNMEDLVLLRPHPERSNMRSNRAQLKEERCELGDKCSFFVTEAHLSDEEEL